MPDKLTDANFDITCEMVNKRLKNSTEASFLLEGILEKEVLLNHYTRARLRYLQKVGEVFVADGAAGMLAGHYKSEESKAALMKFTLPMVKILWKTLKKEDRARLFENMKRSDGADNTSWRKRACGSNYYYIDLVVVDEAHKGAGVFRKLLDPLIGRLEDEVVPVLLDTHDRANVSLYRHFGFELIYEHPSKGNSSMVQYSMIKYPKETKSAF